VLQRDHVVPQKKGGPELPWNGVLACSHCNQSKGDNWPSVWAARNLPYRIEEQWPGYERQWCLDRANERIRFAIEVEKHFHEWMASEQARATACDEAGE
jgi:hypothetical protein